MPCSCGNASCPCGVPCYCLEKSCKCPECAIALHPFCKICEKPLIADVLKDEGTCSCFMGESTVLIFECRNNQQYQMSNIPMPVGNFVNGRLIADARTPVLPFPEFLPQQPISLSPSLPSLQADSRTILPSFTSDINAVIPPYGDYGILSTAKLYQLEKFSREQTCTGISTDTLNTDTSCKETCPPPFFQSTDGNKVANVVQNIKSKTEESAFVQEPSAFYLRFAAPGTISRHVGLTDPVWRSSNSAFCIADSPDSNLNLGTPSHVAGPVYTTQTMTAFEKNCCQQASNFNSDSNYPVQKGSVTVLKGNDQPLDSTNIENPDLEVHGESEEFKASLEFAAGNEFSGFPSSGDSKAISLIEPSNEISESCIIEASCSGRHNLSSLQRQPAYAVSIFSSENNDGLQSSSVGQNVTKSVTCSDKRFLNYLEDCAKQCPLECLTSKSKGQKMPNTQSFENTTDPQTDNPSSDFLNNRRDEKIDPIPLYIDASTTRKMEKLLKSSKH